MDKALSSCDEMLTFTFEGGYEVNAVSVAKAVEGLVCISDGIATSNYPSVEFRLSVKAISPGSLNFVFLAAAQSLLAQEKVQYAKDLMGLIKTCFEVKKFLRGKKPNKVEELSDNIVVERTNGEKITIPKGGGVYFINSEIDASISNIFNGAMNSPGVTGIKLSQGGSTSVEVPREDFPICAEKIPLSLSEEKPKTMESVRRKEFLYIRRPDLLGKYQWGFKTVDKNILADIEDEDFLESVQSGKQPIYARMYIVADLKVVVELGENGMPDEAKCHYSVIKVYGVHNPDDDKQFNLL